MPSRERHNIFNKEKCGAMQIKVITYIRGGLRDFYPVSQRLRDSFMLACHFSSKKTRACSDMKVYASPKYIPF